jgi:HD-like signal output (HDOD) protein
MDLYALLALPLRLPSIPRVLALLSSEFQNARPTLRKVSQLVATDPALTAQVLREANGDAFQLCGAVHGVPEALALLDVDQVHAVVQAALQHGTTRAVPGIDLQHYWQRSIHVARLARALAGSAHQNTNAAYTAGLLHAVGELAMLAAMPDRMQRIDTVAAPMDARRAQAEQRLFGYSYAQAGAVLARQWKLPGIIADALEYQHTPFKRSSYEPLAGIVHLAVWRVRAREQGLTQRELAVTYPDEVGLTLALDIDMVLQQDPFDWTHTAA